MWGGSQSQPFLNAPPFLCTAPLLNGATFHVPMFHAASLSSFLMQQNTKSKLIRLHLPEDGRNGQERSAYLTTLRQDKVAQGL